MRVVRSVGPGGIEWKVRCYMHAPAPSLVRPCEASEIARGCCFAQVRPDLCEFMPHIPHRVRVRKRRGGSPCWLKRPDVFPKHVWAAVSYAGRAKITKYKDRHATRLWRAADGQQTLNSINFFWFRTPSIDDGAHQFQPHLHATAARKVVH